MGLYLGIDTSNYTTSVALYDEAAGTVEMHKKLLPVKERECGLRQSDAVFLHVKQLGGLMADLMGGSGRKIAAVGYSAFPRRAEGSYMPCFLVGDMVSQAVSSVLGVPRYPFSHQEGHIAAALYSSGCLDWLSGEFYAFHVSGGTTEALLVHADGPDIRVRVVGKTLDLNAGQAVDRVGVMLGCSFPCGIELERLALECTAAVRKRFATAACPGCRTSVKHSLRKAFRKNI